MKDYLKRLENGLNKSKTLLYKPEQKGLACSFVNGGLVVDTFVIDDDVIADALSKKGIHGVVEGSNFEMLKSNYSWFSLHVKSKQLYRELEKETEVQVEA